jgi:biotin transport system substrate-specific component
MILYLAMGAAGLPVFTPTVPLVGVARLLGPTGGYLLAYPVAAWAVGWFTHPGRQPAGNQQTGSTLVRTPWVGVTIGVFVGLVLIHLGGLAQLAILTGDISSAARFGTLPFLLGDLIKIAVLVPVLTNLAPTIRARL